MRTIRLNDRIPLVSGSSQLLLGRILLVKFDRQDVVNSLPSLAPGTYPVTITGDVDEDTFAGQMDVDLIGEPVTKPVLPSEESTTCG